MFEKSSLESVLASYRSRGTAFEPEQIEETELPHEYEPEPEPPHDPPADDQTGDPELTPEPQPGADEDGFGGDAPEPADTE